MSENNWEDRVIFLITLQMQCPTTEILLGSFYGSISSRDLRLECLASPFIIPSCFYLHCRRQDDSPSSLFYFFLILVYVKRYELGELPQKPWETQAGEQLIESALHQSLFVSLNMFFIHLDLLNSTVFRNPPLPLRSFHGVSSPRFSHYIPMPLILSSCIPSSLFAAFCFLSSIYFLSFSSFSIPFISFHSR